MKKVRRNTLLVAFSCQVMAACKKKDDDDVAPSNQGPIY